MLSHPVLIFVIRIFLGALFIVASIDKIMSPEAFAVSIQNYKIINGNIALLVATILPPLELLTGACLILGIYPKTSSLLITSMLAIFTLLVITALIRGLDISCGCFTQDPNASKIGLQKIADNIGLIILGIWVTLHPAGEISILRIIRKTS